MVKIQRILVPTDFTPLATQAAKYARIEAEKHGAETHVLHVVDTLAQIPTPPEFGHFPSGPPIEESLHLAADALRRFVATNLAGLSRPPISHVLPGVPHEEICQYALEQQIDLIVIGTHADGLLKRLVLGSVSKAVLEHAPCAVLMVPLKAVARDRDEDAAASK